MTRPSKGKITLKGITYTTDRPLEFSFAAATLPSFCLLLLGLTIAPQLMYSNFQLGIINFLGGLALIVRMVILYVAIALSILFWLNYRAKSS